MIAFKLRAKLIFCSLPLFSVAGCGPDKHGALGLACFPKDAARWIYVSDDVAGTAHLTAASGQATIYVDHSGSMVGYIRGSTEVEKPFQDLIGSLPATLKASGVSSEYRAFGKTLSEPIADGATSIQQPSFFYCGKPDKRDCDTSESHLDVVLRTVASKKDEMALVLSDLWLSNSDIQTTGLIAFQEPLTDILADGRVVAVYGIPAPFDGQIYDLPGAPGGIRYPQGRHPLYLIVVGTKHQVVTFGEQFARSGSRSIAEGIAAGRIRRSLFTVDPGPEDGREKSPMIPGRHPRLMPVTFEPANGAVVQQFTLKPGLPPPPGGTQPVMPSWTGPQEAAFLTDAVWEGPVTPRTRIWFRKDNDCKPTSWREASQLQEGWSALDGGGKMTLALDPARLAPRLTRAGVYMLSGELKRTSVIQPNNATKWMREPDWNVLPEGVAALGGHPATYPTLNLSEMARLMENALKTAAERKDSAVVGFSILVKVEK